MVCPTTAIEKRPDGIVIINQDRCIRCGDCISACPYDVFFFDKGEKIIDKCTMCAHRVDKGLAPACVLACITKAMTFGDLADSQSEIAKKLEEDYQNSFVLHPEMDTQPSIYYKLSGKKRSKEK
jgi:tetrathionate reductase subunit B